MAVLANNSRRFGTVENGLDYALLVDGLSAEREQGVTIDVAYRFFETPRRRFILADAPGHQQYTRNMVTGASLADLAILLVDARKGLLAQTRRHAAIAAMLGIGRIVLAVNKMDLVDFDRAVFDRITSEFDALDRAARPADVCAIPIVARDGDNVVGGRRRAWVGTAAPALLAALEAAEPVSRATGPARLAVQWVNRPDQAFPRLLRQCHRRPDAAGRGGGQRALAHRGADRAHRHRRGRSGRGACPGRRSRWCWTARSTPRAATCSPLPRRPNWPSRSMPASCGWTRRRCSAAAPICSCSARGP